MNKRNIHPKYVLRAKLNEIEMEMYRKELREKVKGPRQIFLEKYKITGGDFEVAKKELDKCGYKSSNYGEEVLQKWVNDEGR